jgi:hypothetical protein
LSVEAALTKFFAIDKPRWNINLFNTEDEKAAAHTPVVKL